MSGAANLIETPLTKVRDQIARACVDAGRDPASVTLVAISKTFGANAIEPVIAEGQRVFGENRVQEAKAKWPSLKERHGGIELHLRGRVTAGRRDDLVAFLREVIPFYERPGGIRTGCLTCTHRICLPRHSPGGPVRGPVEWQGAPVRPSPANRRGLRM